ncbi:NADPH-dependent FMN reductase Lot6 [Aspergillus homomorphus CBS 101889]|uniref:NADPH-dependent FMN reductase Lot6 n=1 Tax=Aspergillus homomorphus (strain CBS 101889) TaxID=1450537 RepID=A0A395HKB4_ASPHC|nr:NADPH-dependent FMN reductase Lot6 [Aspergillus homomorphus CBS 101889]RAL06704.1 NADPH-dependent FMN reductase Lot6 [Aspergillus homomorphus CBS 101889]
MIHSASLICILLLVLSLPSSCLQHNVNRTNEHTQIYDVCILGGGATGTYAAIRLKDRGKRVVVIEQNDHLGGHTETLYLPDGSHVDYGVEGVFDDKLTRKFLTRLGIRWRRVLPNYTRQDFVDFTTGRMVESPVGLVQLLFATIRYRLALRQFPFLDKGIYDLPDPVPAALFRPLREFIEANSLEDVIPMLFFWAQGVGNMLEMPAIYTFQNFGVPHIDALLGGYISPEKGMYDLYRRAAAALRFNVHYQTKVMETNRSDSGVTLTVQHNNGTQSTIQAKKLLVTFPPIMDKLQGFDLNQEEADIFSKWYWRNYYVAIINNSSIPDGLYVTNTNPRTGPGYLPDMPFESLIQYMGVSGYPNTKIVGPMNFTAEDAKQLVVSDITRMKTAGTYSVLEPQIAAFADHSPETLMVAPEEIQSGFYRRLYALQGQRSTFYTGLTFCSDYSSLLWAFTDTILEKMR